MTTGAHPQFILSDDWAIGFNPMNWILYQSRRNKDGDPTGWKAVGYFREADLALKDLCKKIMLTETGEPEMVDHINRALLIATRSLSAFSVLVDALPPIADKAALFNALSQGKGVSND